MGIGRWRRRQDEAYGPADETRRSLPIPGWLAAIVDAARGRRSVLVSLGVLGVLVVLLIGITVSATGTGNDHGRPAFDQVVAEASDAAASTSAAAQSGAAGSPTPSNSFSGRSAGSPTSPYDAASYYAPPDDPALPGNENVPTYPATSAQSSAAQPGVQSSVAPATHSSTPAAPVSTAAPTQTDTYVPPPATSSPAPTPTPSPTKTCTVWLLPGVCLI